MAAGLGFKDFTTGEVLTAADVDGYLMQGIWVFASAAARDAAVTSPQEGNFAYLKDTNVTTYYTGSAWANLDTTGMTNPMTTTGDTIYSSSGSTPARLGIGTAGQVLTVNSGATAPEWATPAGGGGMTLISETVASSLTSLSFSSLGSYKQIYLVWDGIQHSTGSTAFGIRLNNNSTAIYPFMQWGEDNNSGTTQSLDTNYTYIGDAPNERIAFGHGATSSTNSDLVRGWFRVDNYTSSSKYKFWETRYSYKQVASATTKSFYDQGSFLSTSAITSIDIVRITGSASFSNTTNTTIRLYGVS